MKLKERPPSMTSVGIPVKQPGRRDLPVVPPLPFQSPAPSPGLPPATPLPVRTPRPVPATR